MCQIAVVKLVRNVGVKSPQSLHKWRQIENITVEGQPSRCGYIYALSTE